MATKFPENFRRVNDQVYAGGKIDPDFITFFKNSLGGRVIISLDAGVASYIVPFVKAAKMTHVIIPISAGDTTLTDSLKNLVRQIKGNIIDNSQPVYIHCMHGSDRTGLAIALYRVIKKNWDCNTAIADGRRWGYGNGVSEATQKLWKSLVCSKGADIQSAIDDDIVENMRDNFEMGNVPPAFVPQQSWAPDIDRNEISDSKARRRALRRKMLSDINDDNIPMIGQSDLYQMNGSGPIADYGIINLP